MSSFLNFYRVDRYFDLIIANAEDSASLKYVVHMTKNMIRAILEIIS